MTYESFPSIRILRPERNTRINLTQITYDSDPDQINKQIEPFPFLGDVLRQSGGGDMRARNTGFIAVVDYLRPVAEEQGAGPADGVFMAGAY
jgi:hypothetical protein